MTLNNRALATLAVGAFAAVAYPRGNPKIYHGSQPNPVTALAGRPVHATKRALARIPVGMPAYVWPHGQGWPTVYVKTGPCAWRRAN